MKAEFQNLLLKYPFIFIFAPNCRSLFIAIISTFATGINSFKIILEKFLELKLDVGLIQNFMKNAIRC